jgi:hypothetical protein
LIPEASGSILFKDKVDSDAEPIALRSARERAHGS